MHEASLASRFVQATVEEAAACGATRVRAVGAKVGELRGVVDHQLAAFFAVLARGTLAQGARFDIEKVAATSVCPACGAHRPGPPHFRSCERCGGAKLETDAGLELELSWIEVE